MGDVTSHSFSFPNFLFVKGHLEEGLDPLDGPSHYISLHTTTYYYILLHTTTYHYIWLHISSTNVRKAIRICEVLVWPINCLLDPTGHSTQVFQHKMEKRERRSTWIPAFSSCLGLSFVNWRWGVDECFSCSSFRVFCSVTRSCFWLWLSLSRFSAFPATTGLERNETQEICCN